MLIVAVLLVTVVFRFALVAVLTYVLLPRGLACPHCGAQLSLIRATFLQRVVRLVERRWCLECGWQGVVRRPPPPPPPPRGTLIRG